MASQIRAPFTFYLGNELRPGFKLCRFCICRQRSDGMQIELPSRSGRRSADIFVVVVVVESESTFFLKFETPLKL